jgi:carboxyl-terminal processing protease
MPRFFRRSLLLVVLVGAWGLIGRFHPPLPLRLNEASAGQLARWSSHTEATSGSDHTPYDLSALRIFNKVVLYVKDQYVDPRRVKPKEMMVQALEYVEKTVPEVMVDGNADAGVLHVNVNGHQKDWDIHHVDSLWKMSFTMKDIMDFIAQNMRPIDDVRDVEYAAVNGMLSTLDPHTVLLRPEIYRQLQASTKGEFGGLGFVIQMKEGDLTVVKVLPKTPAYRAGIKKDDKIKKIGEESTVNMDLDDAVTKLRGPVDSQVTITIDRDGWDKPHAMTLARAQISLDSVLSKLLASNVGYVRLKGFQGNTTHDMQEAIAGLEQQAAASGGLKGIVLDLRGNPGGLLEQAVQVSDTFVNQGTIVSTVGYSDKMRDEKKAHDDDGDLKYPMAVLVNAGSASASEIVAGALKNLNRATIIGQQTFGKGSVQMLYDFPDNSALKLTIAKYLTPGDVSIQEVGIEPDIALMPTRVTQEALNVFAPRKSMGEADLSHHFGNGDSTKVAKSRDEVVGIQKPMEEVKYLKATEKPAPKVAEVDKDTKAKLEKEKKGKAKDTKAKSGSGSSDVLKDTSGTESDEGLYDQLDADVIDEVKEDFEIAFARDFVLHAPSSDRQQQLVQAKAWVEQRKDAETENINQAIAKLGIDWSAGPRPSGAELTATVSPPPDKKLVAGETFDLVVTAENHGTQPFHRLRAWSESDDPYFDRREFVFGEVKPGEKTSWKVPIKLPKDFTTRREDVTVKFYDDQGALPTSVVSELDLIELPRPAFAFNWQVVDACAECNGNGIADKGEQIQLLIDVTNVGKGKALDSFAQIRNAADSNIFIDQGRFKIGELDPGQTKTVKFVLDVKAGYSGDNFPLKLAIVDEPLEEISTEKITLPVGDGSVKVAEGKGLLRLADHGELVSAPTADAKPIFDLPKGGLLAETGIVNGFTRVEVAPGRFAFVAKDKAHDAKGKAGVKELSSTPFRQPPEISVNVDPSQGGVVAQGDKFTLSGVASDDKGLIDLYVLVNDQKVAFMTAPAGKSEPKMKFSTEFPLKEGNNYVMVVARETPEFVGKKMLVIRRRPAAIAQALEHEGLRAAVPSPMSPQDRPAELVH